ncbi:MAG: nucleotide exchange factor GrpE [Planctomycetes bacterium]|nr:nucleotide exchange factor GrpE [Planctomycetota bacterium]
MTDHDDKQDTESEPGGAEQNAPAAAAAEALQADLARLREERDRLEQQLQRALADMANQRKRLAKEMEEVRHRTLETFTSELLPVLDNFHLALGAHQRHEHQGMQATAMAETQSMIDGIRMVRGLLESALERHGVQEIAASGETFDPTRHEAVGVEHTDALEAGRVAKVLQRGYRLGDRVIRPVRVMVAAKPPAVTPGKGSEPKKDGPTGESPKE